MIKLTKTRIGIVLATALLLLGSGAGAQSLTLEQIVRQALATSPAIRSKRASAGAAKADLEGAVWQRYATPSLEANRDNDGVRTTLLRVQQPLWAGGRIDAGIDAATAREQAAQSAIEEARQDTVLKIIAAYVEATRQQANQETLARGVAQHEELLALIGRRVAQDASPRVDQDLAQSRLYEASNELSTIRQALANALAQLRELAGMPVQQVAPLGQDGSLAQPDSAQLLAQALARSPTLRRLEFEAAAAQAEVELRRASYKPQLSLRLENARSSGPLNGVPAYSTSRVLLVLEAQTGAGLSALSGLDAALARQDAAQQQREAAVRDLRERLSVDCNEWQFAQERLDNARRASAVASEVHASYTRQYTAGKKGWLDVLNAVRESTQSDMAAANASAQASAAALRLQVLGGNLKGLFE